MFSQVRNDVRKNAAIYKDKVLPLTEEVVRHIAFFADSLHLSISEDLKRNEDKAEIGIQMMDKMALEYREKSEELTREAQKYRESAELKQLWGNLTALFTLGISTIVLHSFAEHDKQESNEKTALAVAERENAEVSLRAAPVIIIIVIIIIIR